MYVFLHSISSVPLKNIDTRTFRHIPEANEDIYWQWTETEYTHNPMCHGTDILNEKDCLETQFARQG